MKNGLKKIISFLLLIPMMLSGCNNSQTTEESSKTSISSSSSSSSSKTTSSSSSSREDSSPEEDLKKYDLVDLSYLKDGKVINTYRDGGINHSLIDERIVVNNNNDYLPVDKNSSFYDLYGDDIDVSSFNKYDLSVPNNIKSVDKNQKYDVLLFVHPGAWIKGSKDDFSKEGVTFASILSGNADLDTSSVSNIDLGRRFISISMNHTLLVEKAGYKELSVYRMLDEIDACVNDAVSRLEKHGFKKEQLRLTLLGMSSGSHLLSLYAYTRSKTCKIDIKALIDIVGPISFSQQAFKEFQSETQRNNGADIEDIKDPLQDLNYDDYVDKEDCLTSSYSFIRKFDEASTMKLINALASSQFSEEEIDSLIDNSGHVIENEDSLFLNNEVMKSLSPVEHIDENSVPVFMVYGGKDQVIGVNHYSLMKEKLQEKSVLYRKKLISDFDHTLGYEQIKKIIFNKDGTLKKQEDYKTEDILKLWSLMKIYQELATEMKDFLNETLI